MHFLHGYVKNLTFTRKKAPAGGAFSKSAEATCSDKPGLRRLAEQSS